MLGKHQRGYDAAKAPPPKRLRGNVQDLMASGLISATRAQELLRDGAAAGSADCASAVRPGASGKNAARDLRRQALRRSCWPQDYVFQATCRAPRTHGTEPMPVHMMLPHEVVATLFHFGHAEAVRDRRGFDPGSRRHLEACEAQAGGPLLGLGLWCDGCPCNWDRTESLEVLSLNLPGLGGPCRTLRIPLVGISKKNVAAGETFHDLLEVVRWSLGCLALGRFPSERHDGAAFGEADRGRARRAGQPLPRACLVEIRGDWKMFFEVFGLPSWAETGGICFRCTCTKAQLRQVGLDAPWRGTRLGHWELLQRIRARGKRVSPLFGAPWVTSSCFKVDWLHCADLGVAADFLGNLFLLLLTKLPGGSQRERCRELWGRVQGWYEARRVSDRLTDLTLAMLAPAKAAPKLRASAAQCRALVPFAAETAAALLGDEGIEQAAKVGARHLQACYEALSLEAADRAVRLSTAARAFALQYVALERASPGDRAWRVKPKLHLFLELASEGGAPATCWTYRDEDFGGTASRLARSRGGRVRPGTTSQRLLAHFRLKSPVPRLLRSG